MPPFLDAKAAQFTEEDLQTTRDIAAVRVHVERVIGYIRNFHIFDSDIPITMVPLLEKTLVVCALLTNFMVVPIREKAETAPTSAHIFVP